MRKGIIVILIVLLILGYVLCAIAIASASEAIVRDIQYWLTPWTVGNPVEEEPVQKEKCPEIAPEVKETKDDDTILGPATRVDEEGNIYIYDPQSNAWEEVIDSK